MKYFFKFLLFLLVCSSFTQAALGFEHEHSPVKFIEYQPSVIEENRDTEKPYYLLFSAEWCHWCKVFAKRTLTDPKVHNYLNEHFVNIFIDADIHPAVFQKFKATGWPYTVFLNPNGTLHYRYAGAVYPEDFIAVLQEVKLNIEEGRSIPGFEPPDYNYKTPEQLDTARINAFSSLFRQSVLENFDPRHFGIGKGEKAIYPKTLLYLLDTAESKERQAAIRWIDATLKQAVARIYDPIAGGFFRYAETRDWQTPHYEKMADLNAGNVLILFKVAAETGTLPLINAADQTLKYLTSTLYNEEYGTFLSFQEADEHYYFLNKTERKKVRSPKIIQKVFIDRLAPTLGYLLDVLPYSRKYALEQKIKRSYDFLADMTFSQKKLPHYFSILQKQWQGKSSFANYAALALILQKGAQHYKNERYRKVASLILKNAIQNFYDPEKKIFTEGLSDNWSDLEYHMHLNALLLQASFLSGPNSGAVHPEKLLTYFSAMDEYFEDQVWDTREWEFLERYVPYLRAIDHYNKK